MIGVVRWIWQTALHAAICPVIKHDEATTDERGAGWTARQTYCRRCRHLLFVERIRH